MSAGPTWKTALLCGLLMLGLSGCAVQRVKDDAAAAMQSGQYETALSVLEAGVRRHPDSTVLRSQLLQARQEATTRLIAEAAQSGGARRMEQAQATLARALVIEGPGRRADELLQDLRRTQRQAEGLQEAERLHAQGRWDRASAVIEEALREGPRHAELLALQQRIRLAQRNSALERRRTGLIESRPVSLDFRDANLRSVLDVITRHSGVDFVLDREVRADARVTVLLKNAKVEDAVYLIVSTQQLSKKVLDARTILIYPNTPEKQREHQEQVVRVFQLTSSDAKSAAAFLRSMLRIREPHVDERLNIVAIRESPDVVHLAERLISVYDTQEPEVMLDLEVLEVRSSRLTDLGLQLPDVIGINPLSGAGAGGLTVDSLRGLSGSQLGVSIGGVLLNLKRTVGDFNTLAHPKIRARNREKARVLIGDKVPVVTSTTGQGGFVSESINYLDVGLKLDVESTVFPDDEVAIRVSLEVSSLAREVRTGTGGLAYQIGTRSASTLLRLRDGETQLLAGLISQDERSSASRVPGLGDLPVAGRLFSSQRDEHQRTELVLAITPRIIKNVRRLTADEAELWVGTEAMPRVRMPGGWAAQAGREVSASLPDASAVPNAPGPVSLSAALPATATPATSPAAQGASAPSVPPAPAELKLTWAGPAEVSRGSDFEVVLNVDSPAELRGLPVRLAYSADRLQLLEVEEAGFLSRDSEAVNLSRAINASAGIATVTSLRGKATGVKGQGALLKMKFRATQSGPAQISLVEATPVRLLGTAEPVRLPAPLTLQVQ